MNLDNDHIPGDLLVNLSFLLAEPTGISVYASQVIPHLAPLNPTLLTAYPYPHFKNHEIPANLTPAQGTKGHFKRLVWTQTQLPKIYQQLKADLIFSPIPEAPIFTSCRSILMVHDLIPLRFSRLTSALTLYFRVALPTILKQAQHLICNSQATADDLVTMLGVPANKITPILLGYNQQYFRPLEKPAPPPEKPYFLYLGR
ncbi:MAG: glycosyltransferase, partial [Microcystaceae cyanobacterium]